MFFMFVSMGCTRLHPSLTYCALSGLVFCICFRIDGLHPSLTYCALSGLVMFFMFISMFRIDVRICTHR
jgi:hypothetical protein